MSIKNRIKLILLTILLLLITVAMYMFATNSGYTLWWLGKIGQWFGVNNNAVRFVIANIIDLIAGLVIIAIVALVAGVIKKKN